jgi:hypothetical protein
MQQSFVPVSRLAVLAGLAIPLVGCTPLTRPASDFPNELTLDDKAAATLRDGKAGNVVTIAGGDYVFDPKSNRWLHAIKCDHSYCADPQALGSLKSNSGDHGAGGGGGTSVGGMGGHESRGGEGGGGGGGEGGGGGAGGGEG